MASRINGAPWTAATSLDGTELLAMEKSNNPYSTTSALLKAYANEDSGVLVDTYGTDSAAIQSAINAAGDGGTVIFSADTVYTYDRSHYFYPNQTFIGYGATLKRGNLVSSELTGAKTGNTFPVTDGTKFEVGMEVAAWTNDQNFTNIFKVTGVSSNDVTLSGSTGTGTTPSGAGSYLVVVPNAFSGTLSNEEIANGTPDNVKILGLTFDGNEANNNSAQAPLRWELLREISQLGDDCLVSDCTFKDVPCEGVVAVGSYSKINNCHFENVAGNGIHMSGGDFVVTSNCTFVNTNIIERGTPSGDGIGHQDGAISFSALNTNHIISNCVMDTCLAAVGGVGGGAVPLTITGVVAKDCNEFVECFSDATGPLTDLVVTDCQAIDCTLQLVAGDTLAGSGNARGVSFANILFKNTPLTVRRADDVTFNNCNFLTGERAVGIASISTANPAVVTTEQPHNLTNGDTVLITDVTVGAGNDPSGYNVATVTGDTTFTIPVDGTGSSYTLTNALARGAGAYNGASDYGITVTNSKNLKFLNITVEGSKDGMNISNSSGLTVTGDFINQYETGITVQAGTTSDKLVIDANFSSVADSAITTYIGVDLQGRAQIVGGVYNIESGQRGIFARVANASGTTVQNTRHLTNGYSSAAIQFNGSTSGCFAHNNLLASGGSINNPGGGILKGNYTEDFGTFVDSEFLTVSDGVTEPTTTTGQTFLYVDTLDGDLKVKFGDGTVKTIATDT